MLAAPGIGISLLPKLACPACWPAYAGLLASVGLGFLISTTYLLPLTAGFLALALAVMAFRAKSHRGYGPFLVGSVAAVAVLFAKFLWRFNPAVHGAVGVLAMASAWSAWPQGTPIVEITASEKKITRTKKKVEIFIAGCPVCERTIDLVMRVLDSSHDVLILDMHRPNVAYKAEKYGIRTVPAVVIDGKLAACCAGRGCEEHVLRSALGQSGW